MTDDGPSPALLEAQERLLERQRARAAEVEREAPHPIASFAAPLGPWASDEEIAAYEAERDRERRRERMRWSSIDDALPADMFDRVARDRLETTEAIDTVRRWVTYQRTPGGRRDVPVLVLIGHMGRGKTVAAAWLLANEGGRYVEAETLSRLQQQRWGADAETYRRILHTGVLVVDELGTEDDAARSAIALHDVINQRRGRRLTLLCGNLSRAQLRARLDPRTIDRMRECAKVLELSGESMRKGEM